MRLVLLVAAAALASSCGDGHSVGHAAAGDPHARSLAVSATHACALRQAGLYCWGENYDGQLGDEGTATGSAPVHAAMAGEDIVEVAASNGRTCVRRSTGEMTCWGAIEVNGIEDARQLALDEFSACALRASGTVACWLSSPEPVAIAGLADVVELRGGVLDTYCARDAASRVHCWKRDDDAWTRGSEVVALRGARMIAVTGYNEVCAITGAGNVACHDLDNGKTIPLEGSEDAVAVVGTSLVACARASSGGWTCWNILPPMLETIGSPPIRVPHEQALVEVALGGFRVCGVRDDARVVCATAETGMPELAVIDGLPR